MTKRKPRIIPIKMPGRVVKGSGRPKFSKEDRERFREGLRRIREAELAAQRDAHNIILDGGVTNETTEHGEST